MTELMIFDEYHPTAQQLARHFQAEIKESGKIVFPFEVPAEEQEAIIIWARYEGYDFRYEEDCLAILPGDAITLFEAEELYPLAYSTLAQAAREGRLKARKSGPKIWLTTRAAIEEAIEAGRLKPRK